MKTSEITRRTNETNVTVFLEPGGDAIDIKTGLGFFDHMLEAFAFNAGIGLKIVAEGDLDVDDHHTVEDVGICLGKAVDEALEERRGIARYGWALLPMDDALARVALDLGRRSCLDFRIDYSTEKTGAVSNASFEEFFRALVSNAMITLHVAVQEGRNDHHKIEAAFKALGLAFRQAVAPQGTADRIASVKGAI